MCGHTPLHRAAISRDSKKIKSLMERYKMHINDTDDFGCTPLHYAVSYLHEPSISILIRNGADVNAKTDKDKSPLDLAFCNRHVHIICKLIDNGAYFENKTLEEFCPLGQMKIMNAIHKAKRKAATVTPVQQSQTPNIPSDTQPSCLYQK